MLPGFGCKNFDVLAARKAVYWVTVRPVPIETDTERSVRALKRSVSEGSQFKDNKYASVNAQSVALQTQQHCRNACLHLNQPLPADTNGNSSIYVPHGMWRSRSVRMAR